MPREPENDVQAALAVLGRRWARKGEHKLDLRRTDLRGAKFGKAKSGEGNFAHAILHGTQLCGAHLEGVNLRGAELEGANLEGAHLDGADLTNATYDGETAWPGEPGTASLGARRSDLPT